jgi:hypothetical protein
LATPAIEAGSPRGFWLWAAGVMGLLLGLYLLLHNGLFVANSDGEYYISIARNLALGRGYNYNGDPVGLVPPGWPLVLAGALRLSTSFEVLSWFTTLMMVGASGLWLAVARRFVSLPRAAAVVLLGSTLFWGYHSAILLQSEAIYCLLLGAAVLLGLQVSDGRDGWGRIACLVGLCAAMVLVRWAGVIGWVLVGAAVVSGQRRPALNRQWIALALSALVAFGVFLGTQKALKRMGAGSGHGMDSTESLGPSPFLGDSEVPDSGNSALLPQSEVIANVDTQRLSRSIYALAPRGGIVDAVSHLPSAGTWAATALWMPAKLAVSSPGIAHAVNAVGWLLIIPLVVWGWWAIGRQQWLAVGLIVHCALLVMRWSSANERYLVPVAPLLILGIWCGLDRITFWTSRPTLKRVAQVAAMCVIGSVAVCNAMLLAVDISIARSNDFYARHHGGRAETLIASARYLTDAGLRDGELAVSPLYININRPVQNSFGLRVMNVLTDRNILTVPREVCEGEPNDRLLAWAAQNGVRYYLYRPPENPWRVWHFRAPWLQEWIRKEPVGPPNPYFQLYDLASGSPVMVNPPKVSGWPTHLPGI